MAHGVEKQYYMWQMLCHKEARMSFTLLFELIFLRPEEAILEI